MCGSPTLESVIDLGDQYIASAFVGAEVPDFLAKPQPLEVVRCASADGCGLVQLRHTIAASVLYHDYGYRSGTNEIMRTNLKEIVTEVEAMVQLAPGDVVLDIGCNDGTLLMFYESKGIDRIGIDPSDNVTKLAREKGLQVVPAFFSADAFRGARPGKKAKAVTSIAMFYDLESPTEFVRDVASILAPDGVWVIELSYLPAMLAKHSYDTICHEHLEYYALWQIEWMLAREGLRIHRIEFNESNGGSFRMFIRPEGAGAVSRETRAILDGVRRDEETLELRTDKPYARFRAASETARAELRELLLKIKAEKRTTYIYGASTKGNTILQYCGIDSALVTKAADRNPEKWGKRTLGTNIPIVSEEDARADNPDYFLVLPWHFFSGFVTRERDFLRRGGKFILPLPSVRVVGAEESP